MLSITPPHRFSSSQTVRAIHSARGYLELRMAQDARRELETLSAHERTDPGTILFRIRILLYEEKWQLAENMARNAYALHPDDHEFIVQRIFALYQLGHTKDARKLLRLTPRWLHNSGLLHYNLACYEALIGDVATARECAKAAFALNPALSCRAKRDPDLRAALGDSQLRPNAKLSGVTQGDTRKTDDA